MFFHPKYNRGRLNDFNAYGYKAPTPYGGSSAPAMAGLGIVVTVEEGGERRAGIFAKYTKQRVCGFTKPWKCPALYTLNFTDGPEDVTLGKYGKVADWTVMTQTDLDSQVRCPGLQPQPRRIVVQPQP